MKEYNPKEFFSAERNETEYGYDISNAHAFKDEEMTIEIPIKSISKEAMEKILGGVPIVRCKDCVYYDDFGYSHCDRTFPIMVDENDFCSRGELA